jgi:ribosomal protein S18 acetylase RimI-like enzyme
VSEPIEVVRADASSADALVDTLVDAHLDYVWERWAVRGDDRRERLARAYRSELLDVGFPLGIVHATTDDCSVAIWLRGRAEPELDDAVRARRAALSADLLRDRAAFVADVDEFVASAPCPPADWYLATVGTRPGRRRRGLASAVLRVQLDRLDERHETARLETSTRGNMGFYERRGFTVVAELTPPHGAPTTWVMHRRPAGGR